MNRVFVSIENLYDNFFPVLMLFNLDYECETVFHPGQKEWESVSGEFVIYISNNTNIFHLNKCKVGKYERSKSEVCRENLTNSRFLSFHSHRWSNRPLFNPDEKFLNSIFLKYVFWFPMPNLRWHILEIIWKKPLKCL